MERPQEHVTQTESFNILAQTIPSKWIIRDINNPDYGLDKAVEVVDGTKVTGKELLVQVKGTYVIDIKDGFVSFSLEVDKLKYYLHRDSPVILTVVDVPSKKCYWLFMQEYIHDVLEQSNPQWRNQTTVTIKIPVANEVSSTLPQLRRIAFAGSTYIFSKRLTNIPVNHFEHWKSNTEAIQKMLKVSDNFLQKEFQAKFEVSYLHQKENEYDKSLEMLIKIAEESKSKDQTTYIKAVLTIVYQLNVFEKNKEIFEYLKSIKELSTKVGKPSFRNHVVK